VFQTRLLGSPLVRAPPTARRIRHGGSARPRPGTRCLHGWRHSSTSATQSLSPNLLCSYYHTWTRCPHGYREWQDPRPAAYFQVYSATLHTTQPDNDRLGHSSHGGLSGRLGGSTSGPSWGSFTPAGYALARNHAQEPQKVPTRQAQVPQAAQDCLLGGSSKTIAHLTASLTSPSTDWNMIQQAAGVHSSLLLSINGWVRLPWEAGHSTQHTPEGERANFDTAPLIRGLT
jgi:hypothetical protein